MGHIPALVAKQISFCSICAWPVYTAGAVFSGGEESRYEKAALLLRRDYPGIFGYGGACRRPDWLLDGREHRPRWVQLSTDLHLQTGRRQADRDRAGP